MQVVEDDLYGPIVIDTAAAAGQERTVTATWSEDGRISSAPDNSRPSLVFSWGWSVPGRIYIAGITCPDPQLDDVDLLDSDPVEGCGGHQPSYVIRILDLAERSWTEVTPQVPLLMGRVVNVVSPGDVTMIVGAGSETDPDVQALYRIDLRTGATTPLPQDDEIERVAGCAATDGTLIYTATPAGPEGTGRGGRLSQLTADTIESLETVDGLKVKLACTADGMLLWDPEAERLTRARLAAGQIRWDEVTVPEPIAGDAFGLLVGQENLGGTPAVWESHGTRFQLWRLDERTWAPTGPEFEGYDPPEIAAVVGDAIVLMSGSAPVTLSVESG